MIKKYVLLYILFPLIGLPTVGITWFFWTMPSPEEVCQKTTQITSGKTIEQQSLVTCVTQLAQERDVSGVLAYRKKATCIIDAKTPDAVTQCTQEKQTQKGEKN